MIITITGNAIHSCNIPMTGVPVILLEDTTRGVWDPDPSAASGSKRGGGTRGTREESVKYCEFPGAFAGLLLTRWTYPSMFYAKYIMISFRAIRLCSDLRDPEKRF